MKPVPDAALSKSDAATDDWRTALEARVAALEDQLAIARLMATYGPSVDSLSADQTASLWAEDGSYDAGAAVYDGPDAIRRLVSTDPHQGFVLGGCAHIISAPVITVRGDTAVALSHSQLLLRDEASDSYSVWRISANRWEWRRTAEGWKVVARTNRPLDGSGEARELFRTSLDAGRDSAGA
jgi:ketosteroid isomerase-like protein